MSKRRRVVGASRVEVALMRRPVLPRGRECSACSRPLPKEAVTVWGSFLKTTPPLVLHWLFCRGCSRRIGAAGRAMRPRVAR